jgi:hypothetical protein
MNTKLRSKIWTGMSLALVLTLLLAPVAFADNVVNDVTVGGTDTFTAGGSTTVDYWIVATGGDGQAGCNASDGSAATVTVNIPTDADVTATPESLEFDECGKDNAEPVVFASNTPGVYVITVSVSDSGGGTYHTTSGGFTLVVLEPEDEEDVTSPTITITTPAEGAVYLLNEPVNAEYKCEDEEGGSGLASCVGTVADGALIDTGSVG